MTQVSRSPKNGFWTMENEHLLVRIDGERCWFDVEDKRTGMTDWDGK